MIKKCISKDWLLSVNGAPYRKIDLPNDYAVTAKRSPDALGGAANGFFVGGTGSYIKYITPESGIRYILDIDGAYMCAEIYVNENRVARHPHGYAPFLVDITDKLVPNVLNKIKITTSDMQPSTRWYSGAGIYRDVFMWTGGIARVEPWDVFVKTVSANKKHAKISVSYKISTEIAAKIKLSARIGNIAHQSAEAEVKPDEANEINLFFDIDEPHLWDTEDPFMYDLETQLTIGEHITDNTQTKFGIREISFNARDGFMLNGRSMKLRGGCIHHDHGALGAISLPVLEERKITKLKETGFNAIRSSHNPPSLALLETCDKLGMLVMDEAFDVWNMGKCPQDYHIWFDDWCKRDISYMVKRDRNHPSVISYSTGNEIPESHGLSDGARISSELADEIRKYDTSRPVTSAICGMLHNYDSCDPDEYKKRIDAKYGFDTPVESWDRATVDYIRPLDIVGYNYLWDRVDDDLKKYPDRIIWHSETKALEFFDSWKTVLDHPNVIGDFTWTAYDNLGEAGAGRAVWARDGYMTWISFGDYPWRTCYQGDLDLCGYRRPQSYFREAVWLGDKEPRIFTKHPEHYGEGFSGTTWHWYDVHETWNFEEKYIGRPVECCVYTRADRIDWYLNGTKVAESIPTKAIATATVNYAIGELTAVAIVNGREHSRYTLATTKAPVAIKVTPEKDRLVSDNRDIAFFDISVTDSDGNIVTDGAHELSAAVTGGELLCLYSGAPANTDDYTEKRCHTFEGRALAAVRTKNAGDVILTVYSPTLASASSTIVAKPVFRRRYIDNSSMDK